MRGRRAREKSILITGCSSGIGLDAALTLRRHGWRVFASCRKPEDCTRLREQGLESPQLDYDDTRSLERGLAEVLEATGGTLGALFNNGAFGLPAPVEDVGRDALRAIFETNLFGVHDLTVRVIPVMRAQGHGRIVNCSSVLGLVAAPWRGAYVATKFALEGLSDALRIEMRGTGIEVILIEPGPINSRFRDNATVAFERWIDWQGSARRAQYEESLLKRLYGPRTRDRFERPAAAVSAALLNALESDRPAARYPVTVPTHAVGLARRILPGRTLDWLLSKS